MDQQDEKILRLLSADGKLTQSELADRIGLSLSATQRRVKSLEHSGAIVGYRAVVDPSLIDERRIVFVGINLERHAREDIQAFQKAVVALPMIKEVHHIAGAYDYLLKVAVRDMEFFEEFHANYLASVQGIARITSFVAMSTFKS